MTNPPIASSLAGLDPIDDWLDVRLGMAPDGFLRAGLVGRDPSVIRDLEHLVRTAIPAHDRLSVGAMMAWRWAEVPRAATTVLVRDRRVPTIDPAAVGFLPYDDETPTRIVLASSGFACLPDDPDAGHPDAHPVAGMDDLRRELVRQIERFLEPSVEPIHVATGLNPRAIWGLAAGNALAEVVEMAAEVLGPGTAVAELDALMAHADRLAMLPPSAEVVANDGQPALVTRIGACCRAWHWPGRERKCAFCPLLTREERVAAHLEPEGASPAV